MFFSFYINIHLQIVFHNQPQHAASPKSASRRLQPMLLALITCHVRRDLLNHVRFVKSRHTSSSWWKLHRLTLCRVRGHTPDFQRLKLKTLNFESGIRPRLHFPKYFNSNCCNWVRNFGLNGFHSTLSKNSSLCSAHSDRRAFREDGCHGIDCTPLEEKMLPTMSASVCVCFNCCCCRLLFSLCATHVPLHAFSARSGSVSLRSLNTGPSAPGSCHPALL